MSIPVTSTLGSKIPGLGAQAAPVGPLDSAAAFPGKVHAPLAVYQISNKPYYVDFFHGLYFYMTPYNGKT